MQFPTGLLQPEGSFRFGTDALLLGAYSCEIRARRKKTGPVAELGSGCGAALLALALSEPETDCLGLESESELVFAARENAKALGLADRVRFRQAFLSDDLSLEEEFQTILANPPWLLPGSGRLPVSVMKQKAVCAKPDTLRTFCQAAYRLLMHKGFFCLILPPDLLGILFNILVSMPLGLRSIFPVASHAAKPAIRLLVLIQKGAATRPEILPPLVLHCADKNGWSEAALEFCPWLSAKPLACK